MENRALYRLDDAQVGQWSDTVSIVVGGQAHCNSPSPPSDGGEGRGEEELVFPDLNLSLAI
jgi:hypothetical protein